MNDIIFSPVTKKPGVTLIKEIECSEIISKYLKFCSFDVSGYFHGLTSIKLYRCNKTDYHFYYPPSIMAKEDLYEHLQQFDYYYIKNRFEFEIVPKVVKKNSIGLDIACGLGHSIDYFEKCDLMSSGIDLNHKAIEYNKKNGRNVVCETIQEHSVNNIEKYDFVTGFHILEHIFDVNSFLVSTIDVLKPGGLLILSVPNNDSFGHEYNFLNLPPHHVGLWNKKSMKNLPNEFPLRLKKILFSPLDPEQHNDFIMHYKKVFGNKIWGIRSISRVPLLYNFMVPRYKKGYTMVVCFEKL